jgi:hypothetical protein
MENNNHDIKHDSITGFDFTIDEPFPRPEAIRKHCLECCGSHTNVRNCEIESCELWAYRLRSPLKSDVPRPQAVRKYCKGCHCGNREGVRECGITDCHLWPWRLPP